MHMSRNKYNAIKDVRLSDRITWYVEHCHQLIDHHDQFFAKVDLMWLSSMQRQTKWEWVRHLDIVWNVWEIERAQGKKNQTVMTSFFRAQNADSTQC